LFGGCLCDGLPEETGKRLVKMSEKTDMSFIKIFQ
jgi:hypothetical protein